MSLKQFGNMNLNYHIHATCVKCPYCDKEYRNDDHIVGEGGFGDPIEFECEDCGKIFYAEADVVYNTFADCGLNKEKHDWYNTKSHPAIFHCRKCQQHKIGEK